MGVKLKTIKNKFPEMQAAVEGLNGRKVNVGVKGEQAWLASIHEYGCNIRVTPKMRAWLHYNGLHIKNTTTTITIPERAFLRNGFDTNEADIQQFVDRAVEMALDGAWSGDTALEQIGQHIMECIKDYANTGAFAPNHPFTVQRKASAQPLTDTGDMINSIDYEVE